MCHSLSLFVPGPLMCCLISYSLRFPICNGNNDSNTWFATPLWDSCLLSVRTIGFAARVLSRKLRGFLYMWRDLTGVFLLASLSSFLEKWLNLIGKFQSVFLPVPLSFLLGNGWSSKITCCALVLPYAFNIMEMFPIKEMFSTFPFRESPRFFSMMYDSIDKTE